MTDHAIPPPRSRRTSGQFLLLPLVFLLLLGGATAGFISYILWPTWPRAPAPLYAPAIPVTVAGILFNLPPAAIRAAVQRHPGTHERIDLVFLWPSLSPPPTDAKTPDKPVAKLDGDAVPLRPSAGDRLFVTIAGRGAELPPAERLRGIYPRYVEARASAGPDGLAILPFRSGTPYQGEDLVYVADQPEQFFARCTRTLGAVPGTCLYERALEGAEITLRFPRQWLENWRNVTAGFDRLVARLQPQGG